MKRVRSSTLAAAFLAIALIIAAGTGSSIAYFTTYAENEGGHVVDFSHREKIDEEVDGLNKAVTITHDEGQPVFIRVKAYTGAEYASNMYYNGDGWEVGDDGWYYYSEPIAEKESTGVLNIGLADVDTSKLRDGQELNLAVVFESTLALYRYNEATGEYEAYGDWSSIQDRGGNEVTKGGN